ncbi:helix-turn-helix domain-containing protein [Streptomyces sp. NPDC003860]
MHRQLAVLVEDLQADLAGLALLLASTTASPIDLVVAADRFHRRTNVLSTGLVHYARQRGVPWAELGQTLATSPETLRRSHHARRVQRLLDLESAPAPPPEPPVRTPDTTDTEPSTPSRTACGSRHLAGFLSILHRQSGLTLSELANRTHVSPSYLSRVFIGTDFPTWHLTERLAIALGADADVLHHAWTAERTRAQPAQPSTPPRPPDPTQRVSSLLTTFGQVLGTDLHNRPLPLNRIRTTRYGINRIP